jgi:hypothetical protein
VGRTSDIIEDAIKRGKKRKTALLREAGGGMPVGEAAKLLGVNTEELEGCKSLLSVSMDSGAFVWPAFQFESRAMIHGVGEVLAAINVVDPWTRLNFFFLRPDELGGRTPVQAIREGSLDAVVLAAGHFGDHGAS